MIEYLTYRIESRHLIYIDVVARYPEFKQQIDSFLIEHGKAELIKT